MKNKKKKAELKENGDWDCPDVSCNECEHHRSVEWCSLAIPNHEKIDETYKMVNEAFFEGFNAAEKQYRLLIETVEELDKELAKYEEFKSIGNQEDFFNTVMQRIRPQGKWILKGEGPRLTRECSVCGAKWLHWIDVSSPNYCGRCGAKMKGE